MWDDHGLTFGGDGRLDRAAALRASPEALQDLWARAHILPVWRGKPMLGPDETLVSVRADHPALSGLDPAKTLFLGLVADQPWFAADVSAFQPVEVDAAASAGFLDTSEQNHPDFAPDQRFVELRACMTRLSALEAELAATARALFLWHDSHGFCARCGAASAVSKGGWQRDCPACGRTHFPRTDPVVIMRITHGNRVLVGRSPGWPAGMYSLLAGFVEPGETLEAAVRREVIEEAGVVVGAVRYLSSQPWPFPASLMIGMEGEATRATITIDPVEIEDARWVTREDMAAAMSGRIEGLSPARKGSIARHLIERWLAGH